MEASACSFGKTEHEKKFFNHIYRLQDMIYRGPFGLVRKFWGISCLGDSFDLCSVGDTPLLIIETPSVALKCDSSTLVDGDATVYSWLDEGKAVNKILNRFDELYGYEFTECVIDWLSGQSAGNYQIRKKHFLLAGLLMGEESEETKDRITEYLEEYEDLKQEVGLPHDLNDISLRDFKEKEYILFSIEEFQPFYFGQCLLFFQRVVKYMEKKERQIDLNEAVEMFKSHFWDPVDRLLNQLDALSDEELLRLCEQKAVSIQRRKPQRRRDWFDLYTDFYLRKGPKNLARFGDTGDEKVLQRKRS
jgi:hypothetical protein